VTSVVASWGLQAAAAFVTAFAVVRLVERHGRAFRLLDVPNARSSHVEPRPRGGGTGIVLGVAVAMGGAAAMAVPLPRGVWIVLLGAAIVAAAGLWDDVRGLGVAARLVIQTAAAVGVAVAIGGLDRVPLPPPADVPLGLAARALAVVWLVGVTNFFNFMDGIDGLAGGQAIITFAALTWAMWPGGGAGLALVAAAASLAFLLRNWPPARVFLGDVGSSFLGFLLAGLPLTATADDRPELVLLTAMSLALFLLDPAATLVARACRGAKLGMSHREHAYQQFVRPGAPHTPVVVALLGAGTVLSSIGLVAFFRQALAWPALAVVSLVFTAEWRAAARRRG
jgi:glycosyltransferase WbpL